MRDDYKKQLKEFIAKKFLNGRAALSDGESLFAANIIDSFGMLELIAYIEKDFCVRLKPSDIDIDNFDTVDKIVSLIEEKKNGRKGQGEEKNPRF
ncbi:MAG: acyl carrier protein [Candidatus Omnitrophica bacterium]|nr:acyl carrier protein [Candidatus Omnitrophota bacterium]